MRHDTLKTVQALVERDQSKPAEQQGLFRKFIVLRTDGSDQPGGKHHGCEYFVLDVNHDPHAKPALAAYADAAEATHPELAKDMRERYALIAQMQRDAVQPVAQVEMVASQHERRLSWEAFQSVRAAPHLDRAAVIASGEAQGEKSGVATNGDGSEGWNAGVGLVPIQEGSLRSAVGAELLGGRASELDTGRRGQRDAELRSTESLDAVAPCAASVTRSAAATPHPEARAAQPTQDERNLAAARLSHLLKPGHGLPNDFRLVPRQPEAQALDSQLQQPDGHSTPCVEAASTTPTPSSEGPPELWIQLHGDTQETGLPVDYTCDDVTWCWHQINDSDVRYVRADLAASSRRSLAGDQKPNEQSESASPSVLLIRGEK